MERRHIAIALLAGLTLWMMPAVAAGQGREVRGRPGVRGLDYATNIDPKTLVADQFINSATGILIGAATPRPDQYEVARILLELALQLAPQDAEIWRLRSELARQTGDNLTHRQALQQYCDLAPADDVAQLDLIVAVMSDRQTLAQRVSGVIDILSSASAEQFSDALRSRLASYVAQGAAEIEDQTRFNKYLAMALKLDSTNKQAAEMIYDVVMSRQSSTLQIGAALMRVIRAEPFHGESRLKFARLLLKQGLYEQATTQFIVANRVEVQLANHEAVFDWCLALAATGQYDEALGLLDAAEQILNIPESDQAGGQTTVEQEEQEDDLDQIKDPFADEEGELEPLAAKVPLAIDLELMRLIIFHRAGYTTKADAAYGRIGNLLSSRHQEGDEQARLDQVWLAAAFDRFGPAQEQSLEQIAAEPDHDENWLARIRGFIALNDQDFDKAQQLLAPLAPTDPAARYGLAMAISESQADEKIEHLQQVVGSAYDDLPSLMAAIDLHQMQVTPRTTEAGRQLALIYEQWPTTLRDPNPRAVPLVRLDITLDQPQYGYLEPIVATLRLTNASEIPLALGPQGTIPTDLFLTVDLQRRGEVGKLAPKVVDMNRRLVLAGGGAFEVTARMERSVLGTILTRGAPTERVGFSITAMLDPDPQPEEQRLGFGPLGAIDSERFIERRASAPLMTNFEQWLGDLDSTDAVDRLRALARLCLLAPSVIQGGTEPEEIDEEEAESIQDEEIAERRREQQADMRKQMRQLGTRITRAINGSIADRQPYEQAWVFFFLGSQEEVQKAFRPVIDHGQRSDDPQVRIAYLLNQATDPDSPDLDAAMRHENPVLQRFGKALKTTIKKNREALIKARQDAIERQRRGQ